MKKRLTNNELSNLDKALIKNIIKVDNIALVAFFIIPAISYLLTKSTLTTYSVLLMAVFVIGYTAYFFYKTKKINNPHVRRMVRTPNRVNHCAFYIICILIITFFVAMGLFWFIKIIIIYIV